MQNAMLCRLIRAPVQEHVAGSELASEKFPAGIQSGGFIAFSVVNDMGLVRWKATSILFSYLGAAAVGDGFAVDTN